VADQPALVKRKVTMKLIFKAGEVEIWQCGTEWLVFGVTIGGDPIACPSLGMAHEVAAR
jgi:hypothetical protein